VTGPYESVPFTSTSISSDGTFAITIQNFLQANYFFAIQAADRDGRESQLLPLVAEFIPSGNDLILKNILIPPTIGVMPPVTTRDGPIDIVGYAAPSSTVEVWIDDVLAGKTTSGASGWYTFTTSTAQLAAGGYDVKARFIVPSGSESGFSPEQSFTVSTLISPALDLNSDGVVDAADLSIFLFRWNSTDTALQSSIEFDGAKQVDLSDLSILLNAIRLQ
jgi:hypothetical protein